MLRGSNIFITGCSRGLGLEIVKQLVARGDTCNIIATCRKPDTCGALTDISKQNKNVHVLPLDVTDYASFPSLVENVNGLLSDKGLNILINNAGVSPKSTRINMVTEKQMVETFTCNVVAPLLLTKALLPQLKQGSSDNKPSLIVNMSSILGSIAENTRQGGLFPYRSSKSGLNAVTRSLSIDLRGDHVHAVSVHPGWVRTDMGGHNAPLSAEQSVNGVLAQIDNHSDANNGGFIDYSGHELPW